ncbi:MAG TPA: 3-methyl-2-oxobutanoate hydroxymethyltransferase [Clostridia bacterium]|nr:3-methyl-2-oxobutanoate hydroxymethyltransferase [Clostridia bacterium]
MGGLVDVAEEVKVKQKMTVPQFKEMKKKGQKFTMVTAYDYAMASLVDKSDVEMILVGDSLGMVMLGYEGTVPVTVDDIIHHAKAVVRGAPHTFVIGDMPFGSYNASVEDAVRNATRIMKEGGVDAVKLEGGKYFAPVIKAIVNAGIPVMGHIGLTPQTASALGGFKVQGKDEKAAQAILEDALAIEEAGAFSVCLECVPHQLGRLISERLSIPTMGIGAGPDCDSQVLVIHDMLGLFDRFVPKFVKQYVKLSDQIIKALNEFSDDVREKRFPDLEHSFTMKEEVLKRLY